MFESDTLREFMNTLSPKLGDTIIGVFIRNMITSVLSNYPTPLLLANALFLGSKKDIEMEHKLGASASYDQVKCYRKSSAVAKHKSENLNLVDPDYTDNFIENHVIFLIIWDMQFFIVESIYAK